MSNLIPTLLPGIVLTQSLFRFANFGASKVLVDHGVCVFFLKAWRRSLIIELMAVSKDD